LGFSREAAEDANTFCGTSSYMAPEILAKKTYDHNVDIWALGVLIFYLLFGYVPFRALNLE
jgi:serine/threonine protein kinase